MFSRTHIVFVCVISLFLLTVGTTPVVSQNEQSTESIKEQIRKLRDQLERQNKRNDKLRQRINELEKKLTRIKFQMPEESEPTVPEAQQQQEQPNALNPQITVFSNHLYRVDDRDVIKGGSRVDERYRLRANEIDMRAAIGPYADGVAILAVPETPNGFDAKFEELYAEINNYPFLERPPGGLKVKLGRFRTEFGTINRLHTHDLPFITRPKVFDQFIGGGGFQSEGASAQFFLPNPVSNEGSLQLTLQGLSDSRKLRIANSPTGSPPEDAENYLANLHWQRSYERTHFVDVSLIGDYANGRRDVRTYSLDFNYKWRPPSRGQYQSIVFGGQAFLGDSEPITATADSTEPFGYFLWGQYQFSKRWFAGVRYDWTEKVADPGLNQSAVLPYVSYYWNEQLRTRVGYQRQRSDIASEDNHDTLFFEFNFWFGSHPPHPYWVSQ